ncbi:hypothetical protein BT93_F1768 [Corymbia citriodora subsp. variegata]|nr:hypothetical protein BT93_F1768 [Corymbia citriodora subsp. variegata]
MTILKQLPSRNQRTKGFKVKHAIQIFLLLAICIWLLYQVKHSHDKKKVLEETTAAELSKDVETKHETIKLGRKDLNPQDKNADPGDDRQEEEKEDDTEETKLEETEMEERGGGDDEIDGNEQERDEEDDPEEIEDLIDEEDRIKEDGIAEEESDEKEIEIEDAGTVEERTESETDKISQDAREEHYKGDDASSSVLQNIGAKTEDFQAGLRKVKEESGQGDISHHSEEVRMTAENGDLTSRRRGINGSNWDKFNIDSKSNQSSRERTNEGADMNESSVLELPRVPDWVHDQNVNEALSTSGSTYGNNDEDGTKDSM